ncbi:cation:proton antiporter [Agriterribacter sp.]|uniref:cation:proton antiporter domain-containing protein n=1 Tax=Agriterribacter sp. TaxID=2821509 RepID=UPI002BC49D0A|nr:cation:proton antiporter [Agriterribacter sp.]HRP58204.1 cation:proton antiporter [Agriterribacter sp.]
MVYCIQRSHPVNGARSIYPVLLVLAGLAISFIPGIPAMHIDPELIFFIFLPPLLYEASWSVSWKELWRWRRIISSFAFVVMFLTAMTVAFVSNYFIPGFSLALGFLLGGIGLLIAFIFMALHKYLPTDANMDIVLTLLTPYIMYLAAEQVHSSGVPAVVSGGLLLSNKRHVFLRSASRLRGYNVLESLCFAFSVSLGSLPLYSLCFGTFT